MVSGLLTGGLGDLLEHKKKDKSIRQNLILSAATKENNIMV